MKILNIVTPNEKGQIVIPQKVREALGISPHTPLQLIQLDNSLSIYPISDIVTLTSTDSSYQEILKKTAGSWAGDTSPKTRSKREKIELAATAKSKKAW